MKKDNQRQTNRGQRILGRLLAKELGDDEMKLVMAGFDDNDNGPTTMAVTGLGYEDN